MEIRISAQDANGFTSLSTFLVRVTLIVPCFSGVKKRHQRPNRSVDKGGC